MKSGPFRIVRPTLLPLLIVLATVTGWTQAASSPAVEIALTPRGVVDGILERGEPLPVAVRLTSSADPAQPVELIPSNGTWVDLVRVELVESGTGEVLARARPLGAPTTARATLTRQRPATGVWLFSGADLAHVKSDRLVLRARLTLPGQPATSGAVSADDESLRLVPPSALPERFSARTRIRAQIATSQGQLQQAARVLDEALRQLPNDADLLTLRADVALRAGNAAAALLLVGRVGHLTPESRANRQPPLLLEEVRNRILARAARSPAEGAPPAWSWPPEMVLAPPPGAPVRGAGAGR